MNKLHLLLGLVLAILFSPAVYSFSVDDEWVSSTALIERREGNLFMTGTGFFVKRWIGTNTGRLFLVSNRHVLAPPPASPEATNKEVVASVYLTAVQEKGTFITNIQVHLRTSDGVDLWRGDANTNIDVVVLDVSKYLIEAGSLKRGLKVGFIDEQRFATPEIIQDFAIALGDRVVLLGYPLNILGGTNAIPLAKGGTLATPPEQNFRGLPTFLIDAPLIRGSSGSPVIAPLNQMKLNSRTFPQNFRTDRSVTPLLLGIHSASITDWELVLKRTVNIGLPQESMSVMEGAGFGIAFRAETISQAIDQTGVKRYIP